MNIEPHLKILELGYFEVTEAFRGLPDENVWKRPAPQLLSIGELAGHIAYWEALRFAGENGAKPETDPPHIHVESPLLDRRFMYYPKTIATPPSPQHLGMTAEQVCNELLRVHREAIAYFKANTPDLETKTAGWPSNFTYAQFLEYASFHIAYHTGQMYSVRHLLGETTSDN